MPMETPGLQYPQQNQTQNVSQVLSSKNLKNWFDEFKAKVSKKSQQIPIASEAVETSSNQANDGIVQPAKETQGKSQTKPKNTNLRFRKVPRIPVSRSQDFETASINTIFNRRDSRYEASAIRRGRTISSKILAPLKWVIFYLIPFNYNLPWKLLCLINTCFVIIVIGLASGSTEASKVFSFANGFVCGLAAGCASFVVLSLSFFLHILPKSQDSLPANNYPKENDYIRLTSSFRKEYDREHDSRLDSEEFRQDDFSHFEVLDENSDLSTDNSDHNLSSEFKRKLDDDDYKGWMIEFIGDYELRNSSDIKLKSIFVKLENQVLYLCKTKNNYDADSTTPPVFISQRVYDLNHVKKFSANLLLPKNVRNKQKYVWSKKYPIKLDFQMEESNNADSSSGSMKQMQITLFARSCREKEEWFRKFKRVVEIKRLGRRHSALRSSMRSEESFASGGVGESLLSSFKRFRCRSPSPKRDPTVQTSQSSHLLSEPKQSVDDEIKPTDACDMPQSSTGLVRTKSCELLQPTQNQGVSEITTSEQNQTEDDSIQSNIGAADDSTLTKETADLFSQAIDHSNFLESQPSLDYKEYIERIIRSGLGATSTSDWFNALIGRIFFDVFSHDHWSVWFKRKIQRKLYRIRLPYFMETLTLTQIDLGTNAPQFLNVVSHHFDSSGLFIDFDMAYSGGLTMTFETKLNLLKIKSDNSASNSSNTNPGLGIPGMSSGQQYIEMNIIKDLSSASESSCENLNNKENSKPSISLSASTRTSCESTSDSEDSDSGSTSDSSFDEAELNEISDWEDYGAEKTRQNIVKFVDKIASSRYFQHATENRYIKKKLKDISNCPLVLVVQIQSLNGVLTLNVPPPQTDRLWYGFKPTPELTLKAIPKMGDREVSLSHVTDWIERKLAEEFKKILVIPNMEDIVLPVLKSDHMQYITATR
uniref:Testis-expressed sequence 2 protein n=1 Tax=Aceria tosichella TaxID=561515 RepID=A0A6G1SI07_9ACAR